MDDAQMAEMLASYMEGGFLENIIDMFRADTGLFTHLASLIADERGRVRLGAVALAEEFAVEFRAELEAQAGAVAGVLSSNNPTIRADAAYLLELIGSRESAGPLKAALGHEAHPAVREAMESALASIVI